MDSAPRLTILPVWYILFQTEQRRNELDLMMKMDKTYKTRDYGNIFRLIYAMKRCTRQQIAEKLSISLPTVTHNLNLLTQRGLVYNSGAHHATGGRKANLYQCVADSRLALGIDITRRHLSLVLINLELQIVDKKRIRCAFQDSDAYFAHMGRELTEILSKNGVDGGRLLGVGVSMPVIVNSDQKSISYAEVNAEWRSCIFDTGNDRGTDSRILFSDGNRRNILDLKGYKIIAGRNCYDFFQKRL